MSLAFGTLCSSQRAIHRVRRVPPENGTATSKHHAHAPPKHPAEQQTLPPDTQTVQPRTLDNHHAKHSRRAQKSHGHNWLGRRTVPPSRSTIKLVRATVVRGSGT